jgi:3-dehydroquinate synthase|tara:strand:- start:180 stop:1235 length:1056 start_codon:yes stop_codon:yes gene_type:complete
MKLSIKPKKQSYKVIFGQNIFPRIADELKKGKKYAIITDSNIKDIYAIKLKELLDKKDIKSNILAFKAGEKSKNIETCLKIIDSLSKLKYNRNDIIIALGGGVVGDMAGWIAANYLRGIDYIQIPTTIVAQADSSIGGKTAINTKFGKNLIGAFKQPIKVYIDVDTIKGINQTQLSSGLAEVIKHAVISNKKFFNYLNNNIDKILNKDPETLLHLAKQNFKIKGKIVTKDPYEKNIRVIVNYGHTIGHAVEHLINKNGYIPHGYAVAIGMAIEGKLATKLTGFKELELQNNLLKKAKLPTEIPKGINKEDILRLIKHDKKGSNMFTLPKKIGKMKRPYLTFIDDKTIQDEM